MNSKRLLLHLAACFALAASTSSSAHASCVLPPFDVIWSSPADGDTNVPLDASMLLLTTQKTDGKWAATLDGRSVEPSVEGQYALGTLEPDTDYTFRLAPTERASPALFPVEIKFRTGSALTAVAEAPSVSYSRLEPAAPDMSEQCQAALNNQVCLDGGPWGVRRFDLADSSAVAHEITTRNTVKLFWPAGCEPFTIEYPLAADSGEERCYELRSIDARGERSEPTRFCAGGAAEAAPERAVKADKSSCSVLQLSAARGPAWLGLLLVAVAWFASRRRRSGMHRA